MTVRFLIDERAMLIGFDLLDALARIGFAIGAEHFERLVIDATRSEVG